ncbi:zonular occludens toxin domain-containing protein [Marinobacterium arenosum]|uniref:zonular occludens toxin domain-containing protein n=1 Tax=Marinobacterium arenosum TaxID=2862496 RepID=UPI001C98B29A|nr:zonular occludens toxin domain-containing protein [Marinobacterium arenosum]MBY4675896.1 hypothetical protein [Marinobacterium arenosum]
MYYRILTGTLGAGKTATAVYLAVTRYLKKGRIVCTNVDFYPEHFKNKHDKSMRIYRLPDHPTADDLKNLPIGNKGLIIGPDGSYMPGPNYNARENSLLLLDELAQNMNTRDFNKKGRLELISIAVLLRKMGYDTLFLVQDIEMLDKQIRNSVGNETGFGINMGVVPIPIIGKLWRIFTGDALCFPSSTIRTKFYLGHSNAKGSLKTSVVHFNINSVKRVYNTAQKLSEEYAPSWAIKHHGTAGTHCLLTPYHLKGYKLPPPPTLLQRLNKAFCLLIFSISLLVQPFTPKHWWEFQR